MAKQLPIVDTTTDTFGGWINKFNTFIQLANSEIVTANNSANGAVTTGTGFVIGTFGANTVVCTVLRGGNTVSNTPLTVPSNTEFTGSKVTFDNGAYLGANSTTYNSSIQYNAPNTSLQIVDTFSTSSYRSAKYVVSVTDSANANFQVTEILLLQDGSNTYSTEYATLVSNTSLATFTSDISTGMVRLLATPAVANVFINIARTLIST